METATENEVTTEETVSEKNEEEKDEQRTELFTSFDNLTKKKNTKYCFHAKFVNGLAVGFGIGCIATFIILWATIFFTPKLPQAITYEGLLSVFIYPLLYLLTVGLISLTAGLVKERFQSSSEDQQL